MIEMKRWGKDHWSTFAYVVAPSNHGVIDRVHMRCNPARHPGLAHSHSGGKQFPTRLAGGVELHDYDDYDCVDDIEAAGLIEVHGTAQYPTVKLTKKGLWYASRIWEAEQHGSRSWSKVNEGCDGSEA